MMTVDSRDQKIFIVTDSTCDLPDHIIDELGIHVVPCYINMENQSYLDGIDISRTEFYERLPKLLMPATTAAPGVGLFEEIYKKLIEQGATKILSIHVSGTLSSVMENAKLAAKNVHDNIVEVIDSGQLSLGLGYLVEEAAKSVKEGIPALEVVHTIRGRIKDIFLYAVLDTLDYLRRSGRVSSLKSNLGNLLHIHPIVIVHQGEVVVEMVRTKGRALEGVCHKVAAIGDLKRMTMIHAHAMEAAYGLYKSLESYQPKDNGDLYYSDITPTIGVHVGPKAIGVVCVKQ
jgi:DegV family protein with EDD domain